MRLDHALGYMYFATTFLVGLLLMCGVISLFAAGVLCIPTLALIGVRK